MLENAVVGPYVSIGDNSQVTQSVISNSIIQNNTRISQANIADSMMGNHVEFRDQPAI